MDKTFKNFQKLSSLYENQNANLSAVALQYQNNSDPICFSFVFCKLYPYMITQVAKFFYLTSEDKASFCVEELNKAMKDFDFFKANRVQTVFSLYLYNRLRQESSDLSYDKRKANNTSIGYDESGYTDQTYQDISFENIEILESLASSNLSDKELKYCSLIIKNSGKIIDTDIASILGITSAGVNYIKNSLTKKIIMAL
jgi:DNA-binding CsgD family transcriptional regulator